MNTTDERGRSPRSSTSAGPPKPAGTRFKTPVVKLALGMGVIAAALGFLAWQGLSNNLVYYITPSELLAKGNAAFDEQLRLGGQVKPGSQHWNTRTHVFTFVLQDPKGQVEVSSAGLPPPLFRSGIGAVVQGTFHHGVFSATSVMIKHSANYVAPKPGHLPNPDQYSNK